MTTVDPIILFLALRTFNASKNACSDKDAVCVNFRDCPPIIEILQLPRLLTKEALMTLSNSQCGFDDSDPMVCCVNQKNTPPTAVTTAKPAVAPDPPDVTGHPNLRLLDHDACGRIVRQKVMGGVRTSVFDYPWMALIAYDTGRRDPQFRCGGTIISVRYILTAAHCVTALPDDFRLIGVRVGEHDISKERDCDKDENGFEIQCAERYQDFDVESFHVHPGYTTTKVQNDIALIRLKDSVNFRPLNVKPICLPFGSAAILHKKKATVTGWGETESGSRSYELLQTTLLLVNNERCERIYAGIARIWYKQICAGGQTRADSCTGDSGGPLQAPGIYNGARIRLVQYGVVSYGQSGQCGADGVPGVYTRVAYYMDWILDTMRD